MSCDFCAEIGRQTQTRFQSIYAGLLDSRIVVRDDEFAAMPTLGQLFEGSYLVIPTTHIERYAELSAGERARALQFISNLERNLQHYGPTILFEHGASSSDGTGCGVYHAHVHVVPLPRETGCDELIPQGAPRIRSFDEAWVAAEDAREYLAVRDTRGNAALISGHSAQGLLSSQLMRRRLVELFGLSCPWDWRKYGEPEAGLLNSVSHLRQRLTRQQA